MCTEALLSTEDFIIELFVRVDAKMSPVAKDPRCKLWPGEIVTLALLFAIKGTQRAGILPVAEPGLAPVFSASAGANPVVPIASGASVVDRAFSGRCNIFRRGR
jgi:hypothetical protein